MKKGFRSTFLLALLFVALPLWAEVPCIWTGVERVVAVGDLHGDYANFVTILKGTKIIDNDLHWTAGRTHLVQMGDILDRGPGGRRIFDLLISLEREAEAAGGYVHCLTGNHEEMNMAGIAFDYPEYVTVEQFLSFLPDDYKKQRENRFRQRWLAQTRSASHNDGPPPEALRDFWTEVIRSDQEARSQYLKFFRQNYGQWIAQHNTVIKINDTVFVHGGINEKYSLKPLAEINDMVRSDFQDLLSQKQFVPRVLYARDSPMWDRDLAQQDEAVFEDTVDSILTRLGARHIVVAHTRLTAPSAKAMNRFGGKVWDIDTGISSFYGGHLSALIIEGDNFQVWGLSHEHN
jgi:hypothetical protein